MELNALAHRKDDVDDILQELEQSPTDLSATRGLSVEDILAEMGIEDAPRAKKTVPPPPPPKKTEPPAPALRQKKPAAPRADATRVIPAVSPHQDTYDEISEDETTPFLGKAAALSKVNPDKFTGETELLGWFESSEMTMSKKDQKRLQKKRKKNANNRPKPVEPQGEDDPWTDAEGEEDDFFAPQADVAADDTPLDDYDAYAANPLVEEEEDEPYFAPGAQEEYTTYAPPAVPREATLHPTGNFAVPLPEADTGLYTKPPVKEEPAPAPNEPALFAEEASSADVFEAPPPVQSSYFKKKPWADPVEPDVLTGSAFDTPWDDPGDWPTEGSLFDTKRPSMEHTLNFGAPKIGDPPADNTPEPEPTGDTVDEPTMKSLYVEDMVDDRFREFFGETVSVTREDLEQAVKKERKKTRSQVFTGEFTRLAIQVNEEEAGAYQDEFEDTEYEEYRRPQDAPVIQKSIQSLQKSLVLRACLNGVLALLLFWLGLGAAQVLSLPAFLAAGSTAFGVIYLLLCAAMIVLNFTTIAPALAGLFSEPTVDTPPALAAVATLLQGVVVLVQVLTISPLNSTLFGGVAALLLACNALGKYIRTHSIFNNFQLASANRDHSAGYVLDYHDDIALDITEGLHEDYPAVLINRPTTLMKGFMRQSFSARKSDRNGRIVGWILLGVGLLATVITYVQSRQLLPAVSALAATLCLGAPLTSSLVSGLPSLLLQRSSAKVGAVVPGWSAVEELGDVNVVMASSQDVVPPTSISLQGLRAFKMQNINNAILYAASVVIEGCDTLRDIFTALVNNKADTLYKVESLEYDPGMGYNAWVDGQRVLLGNRDMMQSNGIQLPSLESEAQYTAKPGTRPLYLAVSGKLYGMFVVGYSADDEVQRTLDGLVDSGVSLLITSDDMNVNAELLEEIYSLPRGFIKVLDPHELKLLEPLTSYLDASEGVMSHIGSFASFIGGMRAAAACANAERMGGILQLVSSGVACLLCLVLCFFGGLANFAFFPILLFQLAWAIVAVSIPLTQQS